MKIRTTFVAIGSVCALAATSCKKPEPPTPQVPVPEAAEQSANEEPAPAPIAATATPPPIAPAPAATPAPSHFAPEGVFYLTRTVSVETADGLAGLPPGTKAVKQPDGRYLADGHTVELQPGQITNDLRIARGVVTADQTTQQRIRQALKTPVATPPPAEVTPPEQKAVATRQSTRAENRENGQFTRKYVDPVSPKGTGLQGGSSLNAKHTRTGEGFLWQKSPDGKWWVAVKRLDGRDNGVIPPNKRAR